VDLGKYLQKDSSLKMIVTMTKIQVHLQEIWEIKVQYTLKKEILTSIETLKNNFLKELMEIGKLKLYFLHIHS